MNLNKRAKRGEKKLIVKNIRLENRLAILKFPLHPLVFGDSFLRQIVTCVTKTNIYTVETTAAAMLKHREPYTHQNTRNNYINHL